MRHRTDGADLLAAALGRTRKAVERKAAALGVSLRVSPGEVCPECGCYEVRERTEAARHGLCPVCWERRKAKAMEERAATIRERRRYDAARVAAQRAGAGGVGHGR